LEQFWIALEKFYWLQFFTSWWKDLLDLSTQP
jgi:hypothetical protein